MNPRFDKADAGIFGAVIVFLVIFAEGADIHVENHTIQVFIGMFFGNHGVFNGIHAANRRAVAVAALVRISGTDALQPGDLFRILAV